MPTIIDSLVVKLGLDSGGFRSEKGKVDKALQQTGTVAQQTGQKLQKMGKDGSQGFATVTKGAAAFLALIGGTVAIKRFIEQTIEANAALDRLSKNLNTSAQEISAWSNAAELAGGTAEGLQGSLDMLSKSQTELMLTGESGLIPYFSALGIAMADARGQARPVTDLLLDLSDRFSRMDRATANNMGRMMGIDQGTMNLLLKGRKEVELMILRQKEFGAVSKKQAEEASRLSRQWTQTKQTFAALGRELLSAAMPALEKITNLMLRFVEWAAEHQDFIKVFLATIAGGLVAIALAVTPINLTVAAIIALAAAIALLYDDYQTWKKGGESLIDWGKWEPGIKKLGDALGWIRDQFKGLAYQAAAAVDLISAVFDQDWDRAKFAAQEFLKYTPGGQFGAAMGESLRGAAEGKSSWWEAAKSGAAEGLRRIWAGKPDEAAAATAPSAAVTMPKAPAVSGGSVTRAIRNRNPGNLNFAGQRGATKESGPGGRFAVFGTMEEGVAAMVRQIGLYTGRGINTIRKIITQYAPSSENDTAAYINSVSKATGIGPDQPVNMDDAAQIMALVRAMINVEAGKSAGMVTDEHIRAGYSMARGKKVLGASQFAAGAGASKVAAAAAPVTVQGGSNSVQTNIGTIEVHTAATDANGIAKDIGNSMNYLFTSQANSGLF